MVVKIDSIICSGIHVFHDSFDNFEQIINHSFTGQVVHPKLPWRFVLTIN